jgi:hypothetical protein
MDKKQKEETMHVFVKAFHEVVIPTLEDMEERLASKGDIDRLERKLDSYQDRMDRHGKMLDNHDKRINTLEVNSRLATS